MFEWCIAELRWKASIYRDSGLVRVYQADVVKSDTAIPQALNQALSAAVKDLERVSIAIIISNSTIVSRLVYLCELFDLIIQIWWFPLFLSCLCEVFFNLVSNRGGESVWNY